MPGNHGQIFTTNAVKLTDLKRIESILLKLKGIKDVVLNESVSPREFTVHTTSIVSIDDIEKQVNLTGFHAIPKGLFKL